MGRHAEPLGRDFAEWQDPDGNVWDVVTEWAEVDGRAECVGLTLRSYHFDGEVGGRRLLRVRPTRKAAIQPVTSTIWRAFNAAGFIEQRRRVMAEGTGTMRKHEKFRAPRRRGLTGADGNPLPPMDALEAVARVYTDASNAGRNPTKAVAEAFTLSDSAAAKRVSRARAAGLLPPTTAGRARAAGPDPDEVKRALKRRKER